MEMRVIHSGFNHFMYRTFGLNISKKKRVAQGLTLEIAFGAKIADGQPEYGQPI